MASGALDARRTMDALMALDAVHVLGNHDRYLIDRPPEKMGSWDRPAHAQLDAAHLDWLRSVPATCVYQGRAFLCHAMPDNDETYWLETVKPDGSVCLSPREEIERAAEGIEQSLILCAHSHIARAVRLRDGRLIVNPGSVGCPGLSGHPSVSACHRSRNARRSLCDPHGGGWRLAGRLPPCAV